ncbi:MAG TPA: MlaD family protein [Burkholderiaceae bacterium]|nr:MlaD family protein [Burkholderiaceae bacterium]
MDDKADPPTAPAVRYLELKAALLLALLLALVGGTALYLMYARGVFEQTQRLVLLVDDSEGVRVGMDLTFSGFPIGRVRRVELSPEGNARILVDVPRKDAHWLRASSMFTLVRSLVGGASLRAYSGVLTDPPLPDGAERKVLVGDTAAQLPILVASAQELIGNLNRLTAQDSALASTLANLQTLTEKLNGPQGAAGALLGKDLDPKKIAGTVDRVNALLARLDGMAARADAQVLGPEGLLPETRASVVQLNALLADARGTLRKVDALLAEAQAVAGNVREGTTDLAALRREVDATVRKVESMVDELNRKWPFAKDPRELELKLK